MAYKQTNKTKQKKNRHRFEIAPLNSHSMVATSCFGSLSTLLYSSNLKMADLFYKIDTKYSLRNKEFAMPRFNTTTYGKHSIRYIGPKLWSLLPENVRDLPSLSLFRQRIRKFHLNSLLADTHCSDCILCRT